MSAQAPQVLSRRTNGVPSPGANQTNEASSSNAQGKAAPDGGAARSSRGRGTSDKGNEPKGTSNDADTPKASRTKAPSEGEKVVVRRLPPGMTQAEFVSILGQDWEMGKGKVDWFYYARGKVSNDPSKPTRPGRAYIHLMRKDYILPLSEVVRAACWEDAKNTYTSPSLIGPPSLEFAVYKKTPGNKKRIDARQGTIDQDPEFMAFLEGLANPTPAKEGPENDEGEDGGKTEITTTPLIEFLKEKKANKIKEAAAAKSAKHSRLESSSKGRASGKENEGSSRKGKDSKGSKSDKGPSKDNVKILTKKAAVEQVAETARNVASQISSAGPSTAANKSSAATAPTTTPAESAPKNRRAGIAQAARILQRDLGLSPGSAHRRARQDAAKADADSKPTAVGKDTAPSARESQAPSVAPPSESTTVQPPKAQPPASAASKTPSSSRRSRGSGAKNAEKAKNTESTSTDNLPPPAPVILKKKSANESDSSRATATASANTPSGQSKASASSGHGSNNKPSTNASGTSKSGSSHKTTAPAKKNPPNVSASTARGFVKHVSISQGMSEPILRQALEAFGTIASLELDKRKGFAYVDFADHASLAKAISSSPITVAQGTVNVMERKDKKPATVTATTSSATSGLAAAAAASAAPVSNATAASEKSTSRGRRGRGGGANKKDAAAAAATAANGSTQVADPPATTGPG